MRGWISFGLIVNCRRLHAKLIATTITHVMKKLLLIFAFLIFPMQVAWGMMGAYCQQQQSTHTLEYAKCVLPTHTSVDNDQDTGKPDTLNYGVDCWQCGVSGAALVTKRLDIFTLPSSNAPPLGVLHHLSSIISKRPERPQWFAYAL